MPGPLLLVVVNDPDSGPGRLLPWLEDLGVAVDVVEGHAVPSTPDRHDGVVLLGGGLMPDDDAAHPWLPRERDLARRCVGTGTPLLGVCLGGQLLSLAHGGTVVADSGRPERGLVTVTRTADGAHDPVLGRLPEQFPAMQNHRDEMTDLPPGAVHLATSTTCPVQAFRLGTAAWGLQFHPEAGAERMARWDTHRVAADGFDLAALRRAGETREPASRAAARSLVEAFVDVVRAA